MGVFVQVNGKWFHVDNLAEHAHDFHFTSSAWKKTLDYLKEEKKMVFGIGKGIEEVIVWSDGGLKTKENIHMFQEIAAKEDIVIDVNFYGAYHGHNVEDGWFGGVKRKMRERARGGPIRNREQVKEAFEEMGGKVVDLEVEKSMLQARPIKKQIRKWFEWLILPWRAIFCRERSGEGAWHKTRVEEMGCQTI